MRLINRALDLLAPSNCLVCGREGSAICTACTAVNIQPFGSRCYLCGKLTPSSRTCPKCAKLGSPRHVWICTTHDNVAEKLLEQYKFDSHRVAAKVLAKLMAGMTAGHDLSGYVVVPVPSASARIRERGFDHCRELARQVAAQLNLPIQEAIKHSGQARQVGSSRAQRFAQASKSYYLPAQLTHQKVLLVDDVVTTGATIQACARLLRKAGAGSVNALAFAKRL